MKYQSWRDSARPIIQKVLQEHQGKDEKEIRKALKDAYPFGERRYHPYKVWCDEIHVQMGKRKFGVRPNQEDPNQLSLI
jgi:hypothetical protein